MLDNQRAGFHEIAGVDISHAADVADDGVMDVTAHDPLDTAPLGLGGQFLLERADEIDRVLHFHLRPGRERPIGKPELAPHRIEPPVGPDGEIVGVVAEEGEPFGVADDDVELVAVHDEITFAVRRRVDGVALDLDAAEGEADELAGEFVVIAGHPGHARAVTHLAQKFLDHVVVALRPVPARAQLPAVDDVADQIDAVGVEPAQHVQDHIGLTAMRAEMEVGQEQGAEAARLKSLGHGSLASRFPRPFSDSRVGAMTPVAAAPSPPPRPVSGSQCSRSAVTFRQYGTFNPQKIHFY